MTKKSGIKVAVVSKNLWLGAIGNLALILVLLFGQHSHAAQAVEQPSLNWYFPTGNGWPADVEGYHSSIDTFVSILNQRSSEAYQRCMGQFQPVGGYIGPCRRLTLSTPHLVNTPPYNQFVNGVPYSVEFDTVEQYTHTPAYSAYDTVKNIKFGILYSNWTCPQGTNYAGNFTDSSHTNAIRYCFNGAAASNNISQPDPPICKKSPNEVPDGATTSRPIIPATGQKILVETDHAGSSPHPLELIRTYLGGPYRESSPLPNALFPQLPALNPNNTRWNWSLGLGARLVKKPQALSYYWSEGNATAYYVSGREILFNDGRTKRFLGSVYNNMFSTFSNLDAGPWRDADGKDTLTENFAVDGTTRTGFTYRNVDSDAVYKFDLQDRMTEKIQRNGWAMRYTYDPALLQTTVTNQFGKQLRLNYNAANALTSAVLPDGSTISYTYDNAARLSVVRYQDNTSKTYVYENAAFPLAVTGIIDENNNRLATFTYDAKGRAVESTHALGADRTIVNYPADPAAPTQITDALNNTRSYQYSTILGQLAVTSGDKPAASGGNDAASRVQNALGLIDSSTDFAGFITNTTWDTTRRLPTSTTRAAGRPEAQTTNTVWHPSFRLPVQITEQGKKTDYTYDAAGNKLTQVETDTTGNTSPSNGQVRTWAWTYHTTAPLTGLVATSTDPRGKVTSYTYDTAGTSTGNVASMTNPLGHVSSYLYDGAGRVTRATEPNGLQTSMAYDARGRLTQTVRGASLAVPLQQKTVYTYTAPGQVASATLPNGYQVSYSYDVAQRLVGALDNRGNRISYTLDGMGNRVREEVKDASNQIALVTRRVINSLNRVSAIQGSGSTAPGAGTALGQTTLGYDANGEPVQSTDPLGQTTRQTLDALRRPTSTQLPDNAQASVAYNALNQITQATDPKAVATVYVKNAWGEVLTETSPDSGTTSTTRDAAGNVLTSTDARGNTTQYQYQYDNAGRVSQITQADGKLQLFSYDGTAAGNQLGTLREITDTSGTTSYERDAFGRITKKTQTVNDNPASPTTLTTRYMYTAAGELAAIRYPSGLQVNYARSATGQISAITTQAPSTAAVNPNPPLPFLSALAYTAWQQPQAWQWAGMGGTSTATISAASRSFDADGRMTANQVASYTFDAASRITSIQQNLIAQRTVTTGTGTATTSVLQNVATPVKWQIGYDSRDRVTSFTRVDGSATSGEGASYTYDPNSNRLASIAQTTTDTNKDGVFGSNEVRKNTSQALNIGSGSNILLGFTQVLTTVTGTKTNSTVSSQVNYTLDVAGNLTSDGLRTFAYDSTNRLSTVTLGSTFVGTDTIAGNELASQSYLHNALGQRVFKSEPRTQVNPPNSTTLSPDFVTWLKNNFSWLWATAQTNATLGDSYNYGEPSAQIPSWALLGEYGNGGASSTGRTEYIWLPTEDGSAIPVGMYRSAKFYAIHTDHLGTPRLITDNTNQPVWQWAYSAFGDNSPSGILKPTTAAASAYLSIPPTAGSGTATVTLLAVSAPTQVFNLRFPGQYSDSETGWFYNTMRSYLPTQDRYGQNDPIGLRGGWNRSVYANANAVSNTDPMGLQIAIPAPTFPVVTTACLANPAACAVVIAGSTGIVIGNTINPVVQPIIANIVDACTPGDNDPCKGFRNQIKEHERKLNEYITNPLASDNRGFLGAALASGNQSRFDTIYASRIASLQFQIANFRKQLEECERRNGR